MLRWQEESQQLSWFSSAGLVKAVLEAYSEVTPYDKHRFRQMVVASVCRATKKRDLGEWFVSTFADQMLQSRRYWG